MQGKPAAAQLLVRAAVAGWVLRTYLNTSLDVSASYPTGECVFNISKETTRNELIDIEGVPNLAQRMAGINLSGGKTNAVECAVALYGVPTFDQLLDAFTRQA